MLTLINDNTYKLVVQIQQLEEKMQQKMEQKTGRRIANYVKKELLILKQEITIRL